MFVNYVREINAFHRFANDNYLSSSERLLWFGLMDCINSTFASGADWPGEFVSIPNKKLLSHVPFSEDALIDARNRLKQRGLLEYLPGKKNKEAPKYKIHYFAAQLSTGYQQDIDISYPEKTGNMPGNVTGNMRGNMPGNVTGNTQGNMTDINLNVYPDRNPNHTRNLPDVDAATAEQARAREAADAAFRLHFGRSATIAEANRLAVACVNFEMEAAVLQEAIKEAAVSGAKNPAPYALRILSTWQYECIHTHSDLDDYRVMYDMYNGRGPFLAGEATYDELQEAREKRRIAHSGA